MSLHVDFFSRLPIQIRFTAAQEREYSFNLLCQVKRKLKPLVLNVKAQGYAINTVIACKGPDGKEVDLQLDKGAKRVIDFKQVHVNEKSLWEICVYNHGLYSFEYKWTLSEMCLQPGGDGGQVIMVQPEEGVVPAHDKVRCSLVFSPAGKMSLKGSYLTLSVSQLFLWGDVRFFFTCPLVFLLDHQWAQHCPTGYSDCITGAGGGASY